MANVRMDGWRNLLAGIGSRRDKRRGTEPEPFIAKTDQELTNAYMSDGYSRNVVDVPADDMTREWIGIQDDPDGKILRMLSALRAETSFNEALKWSRLYGGAFIVVGAMDGRDLSEPLDRSRVSAVEYLYVGDRTQVSLGECVVNTDPRQKEFGQIVTYRINFKHAAGSVVKVQSADVHASRVLPFYGELAPKADAAALDATTEHWGTSALQACWDRLQDLGGISSTVATKMYELIVNVYGVEGLSEMLASGREKEILARLDVMAASKSMINGVLIDSRESWNQITASLSGVPDVLDRYMIFLSGVARIPATRLFGRSPSGLNATGESDLDTYYDSIRAKQKNELQEPLQDLVDILAGDTGTGESAHPIEFKPLRQETEATKATRRKDDAAAVSSLVMALNTLYVDQVIGPEQMAAALVEVGKQFPVLAAAFDGIKLNG